MARSRLCHVGERHGLGCFFGSTLSRDGVLIVSPIGLYNPFFAAASTWYVRACTSVTLGSVTSSIYTSMYLYSVTQSLRKSPEQLLVACGSK